jgi:hypothetical protein
MSRLSLLLLAAFAACSNIPTNPGGPFVRGMITFRTQSTMFVDGGGDCSTKASLWIDRHTVVFRPVGRYLVGADTGQLVIGRRVSAWISGVVLESCPPQAGATKVVLEDSP